MREGCFLLVAVTENKSTGGEELLWFQHKWCPLVTKTAARWKPRRREKLTRRGDGGSGGASNSLDRLNVVFSLTELPRVLLSNSSYPWNHSIGLPRSSRIDYSQLIISRIDFDVGWLTPREMISRDHPECRGLQICDLRMLTERERHGMAELLARMDPVDLISLAQVKTFSPAEYISLQLVALSDGDIAIIGGRHTRRGRWKYYPSHWQGIGVKQRECFWQS